MASPAAPNDLLTSLHRDGFVRIPSVLSPDDLSTLRAAAARITALARSGKWPHIRTLPKQFPPWPSSAEHGIWGVQHLLHPSQPDQPLFLRSYLSDSIISPVKQLLECSEDKLVMELYNLLVRPDVDFALRWHRDDIGPDASAEEEEKRLGEPGWHAQWNLALWDDRSLVVVPGSHRRARTEEERMARPYEEHMPGQKVVEMGAGDVVFYNNNILHRGVYDASVERMTLHGSIGHVGGSKARARNVLQHGIGEWVEQIDFGSLDEPTRKRAEGMRKRLVEMGTSSGNVGFFSENE
ncbi:hypothetical protein W97_05766 [Coniosporium apollinis CBS 100218]|uniref:Phytanoyl-CoA dioxygenase n=1 Tax=Coniosporium apollinis (strain CBS 100218) TaxID=1168221 RepID=R7YXY3_CONA1|nr:uncharacterized protein W97_05766 [Coniosporium apollinis CBS 100218]EON66521.1 hypothetical protein W97_05766 [Coniosporium apollinis CBS 100218]